MENHALHNLDESLLLDGAFLPPPEPAHEPSGNSFDESEIGINRPCSNAHTSILRGIQTPSGFSSSSLLPPTDPTENFEWFFQNGTETTKMAPINLQLESNVVSPPQCLGSIDFPLGMIHFRDPSITAETHRDLVFFLPPQSTESGPIATPECCGRLLRKAISHVTSFLPIFHQPTLDFNLIPRELCAAILCVGLLVCDEPGAHEIGCSMLPSLRAAILRFVEHVPVKSPQIWVLEAMILVEIAGMFYADRMSMELSDIFHGTLVTLARRLRLFEASREPPRTIPMHAQDERWAEWIKVEKCKRLGYSIFVIDVQHALLFGHGREILSPLAIKLDLPCPDSAWQASNAQQWAIEIQNSYAHRLKFHEIHQEILSIGGTLQTFSTFDAFTGCLFISGLVSIDLDWRERCHGPFFDFAKLRVQTGTLLDVVYDQLQDMPESQMKSNALTMYYLSSTSLRVSFNDLEDATNSGFSLAGTTPSEQARTAIVRLLTKSKVCKTSARHAIRILRLYTPLSPGFASPLETSALYLSALTLWAYALSQGCTNVIPTPYSKGSELEALDAMTAAINSEGNSTTLASWLKTASFAAERLSQKKHDNAKEYSEVLRGLIKTIV
ncbi:hypothetical protein AOQ84DRAFT_357391 [Glonium stellatum]|uniref:Xylanolytic transcriptional activator regulatory domain-containing protein n=1 Tax=Glonium stellatum TaxID=574774 RepID=A0A8E2EPW2_9PEZI|nr:hypothetical protein AOQ84DRAFT_357391 [Glonium stellatum]